MVTWPAGTITRVVGGTYLHANNTPRAGKIVFTPTAEAVTDASGAVIVTRTPIVITLDTNGQFSEAMATTDNYLLTPNTWAYDVAIRINGLKPAFARIYLPFGDGTPIDLPTHILYSTTDVPSAPLAPVAVENPVYPPVITPRGPIGPKGDASTVPGPVGPQGDTGPEGAPGLVPIFTRQNDISPVFGLTRFYFEDTRTIVSIRASVGTPSVGSPVVVSTKVNGVSIGTIYIAEGEYTNTLTTSYTVNAGDYTTVDILAVGSTYSGSDLSVILSID
jgi:hypothetical protein